MTDKRPKPEERKDAVEHEPPSTDRPPFDPAQFARESDARIRAAAEAPVSSLPTVRPPGGSADILAALSEMREHTGSMPDVQVETSSGARDALGMDAIPFVAVSREDLAWFDLGPEEVKLLSSVNGVSSLEAVCAKASITVEEGASLFLDLAERGVVGFR